MDEQTRAALSALANAIQALVPPIPNSLEQGAAQMSLDRFYKIISGRGFPLRSVPQLGEAGASKRMPPLKATKY